LGLFIEVFLTVIESWVGVVEGGWGFGEGFGGVEDKGWLGGFGEIGLGVEEGGCWFGSGGERECWFGGWGLGGLGLMKRFFLELLLLFFAVRFLDRRVWSRKVRFFSDSWVSNFLSLALASGAILEFAFGIFSSCNSL
jgi:hypothetical protein